MSITINTYLNKGICKSSGGGETRTNYEFSVGPRNLMRAIGLLKTHRVDMRNSYGNEGCGRSWIEIDGNAVDEYELDNIIDDYRDPDDYRHQPTRTEKARALLAKLK